MKSCRLWIGVVVLVAIPSVWVSPLWGGSHGMAKVSEPVVREIKELIPKKIPLDEIRPVPTEFLDQLEREGRLSPPWSDDVAASPYYLEENYTSMAVDATGRIWIGFSFDYPGGNAIAWGFKTSTDFGVSWDTRAWYISGVDYLYPSLAITDDGKYYFFGVLYSGTYNYYPCYCQSPAGQYNDPDAMDGVYYFSIPQRYYPEVKTYGNGNQFVIATYTRESGSSDTVFCLYSHDGMTNAFGLSFGLGTELQYTSIGVNVTGPDTILVHGFDEYVSDWNVYCLLDTLNGSGSLYGWYTTNTLNDVCPRVFFDQNYAYIAYTGEVGIFNSDIMFSYSTDNGANWSGIADITNDGTDETYCRLSGIAEKIGCVYIYGGNRLRFLYSYDNGQNWSAYEQVNDNGVNNVINEYSSASLLWTTGRLYASWTDNRDGDNDIYASYRDVGQGDITHRPDILLFDYTWVPAGPPPERIVSLNLPEKVDPRLKEHLAETSKDEYIPTVILLSTKLNHEWLLYKVRGMNRKDRREFVVNELRRFQKESQGPLITFLNKEKAKGKVKRIVPDMSGFSVYAEVKPEVIEKLAMRPDVGELGLDEPLEFIGVTRGPDPYYKIPNWYPEREICWGVEKINAPDVWALGYTGDSIIVGHLDSGCDYNHPDLADHMWDGTPLGYPNHGWDFVDDDNNPMDEDGHGTNTGGIIAGDGTSGSYTGVAPDAQLMVQRVYPGGQPEMGAAIDSCLSWGADLISTSVGWSNPSDVLKDWNRNKCNSIYAAGLIYSTAAGNEGYTNWPNAIIAPACVPPPKPLTPGGGVSSAIALGATNSADGVASWSSRGPTEWNTSSYNDYIYPPGLLKPDLAAPGVYCKSTALGGGYETGISGTSFSQPHFAGMVALMLDREPNLSPDAIDSIAKQTAVDIDVAGDDSLSGAGRIDALAAVNAISEGLKQATLWVINQSTATGLLDVDSITRAQNKDWLIYVNPTEFVVGIGDSEAVIVQTDTTGAGCDSGANYDTLLIWSNSAFDDNPERVPVILLYGPIGVEEELTTKAQLKDLCFFTRPNPINRLARIELNVPSQTNVRLAIYDGIGRKVRTIVDEVMEPGRHLFSWKGDDERGRTLPAGIYFLVLEEEDVLKTQKVVLIR